MGKFFCSSINVHNALRCHFTRAVLFSCCFFGFSSLLYIMRCIWDGITWIYCWWSRAFLQFFFPLALFFAGIYYIRRCFWLVVVSAGVNLLTDICFFVLLLSHCIKS
jgi:hypothetical protein